MINNGNRTEWSPIRSVIIRGIAKLDDRQAGAHFVNHEYDYRPKSDDTKSHYQLIIMTMMMTMTIMIMIMIIITTMV